MVLPVLVVAGSGLVAMLMHQYFIYRMDPNSSYLLKIRLLGNPKKARKDIGSFWFEKVIRL